jgi:predicted kinase
MNLIIIRGLPGAGKSTYAKKNYEGILHLEADMFSMIDGAYVFNVASLHRNHSLCQAMCDITLNNGSDCVVSNTFTTHKELIPYIDIGKKYGAKITIVSLQTQFNSVHKVPSETIQKMKSRWEVYQGEIIVKG